MAAVSRLRENLNYEFTLLFTIKKIRFQCRPNFLVPMSLNSRDSAFPPDSGPGGGAQVIVSNGIGSCVRNNSPDGGLSI